MPQSDFTEFKNSISEGRSCKDDANTGLYYCACFTEGYSDFPDFKINIAGSIYTIPSTSYMIK